MAQDDQKYCSNCKHAGWEPDSDIYCGHPVAFEKVSSIGASPEAMARLGLCTTEACLWERRR